MKHALILLLLFISIKVFCQEHSKFHPDYFSIGYFGEKIVHPGLTGNIGYMLCRDNDSLMKRSRFDFGLGFVGYINTNNHIGFHFKPQFAYYHIFGKSLELGLKTEIGYMQRFYQGETFEVLDNGEVKKVTLAGQNALMYGAFISVGQNFWFLQKLQFRWFMELGAFWEYPYNDDLLMHPSIAIGISKKLK